MAARADRAEHQTRTTILVVDDAAASRCALGAVLRRAGHRVVPVATGGEALLELKVRLRAGVLPDVALVDVGLPDMSGFELCRRVKALPLMAGLPVVHFSAASVAPSDRCAGLDAGGEAYLTVPAEPEEIQAVVRAALRGARMRSGAEHLAQDLTLLSETIVSVQAAHSPSELARAAAEGTARLTGGPAAVFVVAEGGGVYCGAHGGRATAPPPDAATRETVTRLVRRVTATDGTVLDTVVPAPLWPPGLFPVDAGEDVRMVVTRTRDGRAAVCLTTPTRRYRGRAPGTAALVARLAQATAMAAQPLLMYQVERHVALTLQHSFLPKRLPELPGVDVVVRYEPASRETEIGGDFYAALRTDEGVLAAVGDVVGHSLEAATVMVEIRHALRAYCVEEADPRVLARRLDRMLQRYHPEVTATLCLALVDPATGRTRIANAGHIPPLVVRDRDDAAYVPAAGPLLGLGLDRPVPTETVLGPADRLLMVTDGLIESRGTDLSVSMEELRTAAAGAPDGTAALCDAMLLRFGRDRDDDIALLALRLDD